VFSSKDPFTALERRAVITLAGIFWLRMFGLFLVLPVLAAYARNLPGSTPTLIGIALGAYGLTQALLQIPYGLLSDRFGRKRLLSIGLVVFAVGSVVAALAEHVVPLILGRALQGAGAIAAVILALTADLTRDQQRTKAMAVIGMSIGGAFFAALLLAPPLTGWIGVSGLFWMTMLLAVFALFVLLIWVPEVQQRQAAAPLSGKALVKQIGAVLRNGQLLRLDLGIFILHFVLTAMFVVVPLQLIDLGLASKFHWQIYLPVLLASVLAMVPLIMISTRSHWLPRILIIGVSLLLLAEILLANNYGTLWGLALALWVFFWGFNLLEATLPSLVSRLAPSASKGMALGVYNTFEFAGVFCGGTIAGWIFGLAGPAGVFYTCGAILLPWLVWLWLAPPPRLLESRILNLGADPPGHVADSLLAIPGVQEVIVVTEEGVAYLKVDSDKLDEKALENVNNTMT